MRRQGVRLGVAGAVLAFVALAAAQTWTIPAYQPQDEAAHVGYALVVGGGRLPTIDTPIPSDGSPRLAAKLAHSAPPNRQVWTANHPPLFYLLASVPLRLGTAGGHPLGGLKVARLVGVGLSAVGVALVALLALWLLPDRPQLAVAAAWLAALAPVFVHVSATLYNDSLAFLTSTATLLAAAAVLLRGPSRGRLAALAAAAAAASLARESGLLLAGLAGVAAAAAVWFQGRRPAARRLLWAGAAAAAVWLAAAAASGWFYLRNLRLYGDVTGSAALLEKFHRLPHGPIALVLRTPGYWIAQQQRFWDISANLPAMAGRPTRLAWLLVALPAAGLLLLGARWLRARRRPPPGRWLPWLLLIGLLAALELTTANFYSRGGNAHARYLLPALAVLGIAAAAGLAALPGARRGWPALLMLAAMVAVDLKGWDQYLEVAVKPKPGAGALGTALAAAGGPGPGPFLAALCVALAAALAMVGRALWLLGDGPAAAPAVPAGRPRPALTPAGLRTPGSGRGPAAARWPRRARSPGPSAPSRSGRPAG